MFVILRLGLHNKRKICDARGACMAHVNKMIFLIHGASGSLLRCVYRTCSYCDDDENSIYQPALICDAQCDDNMKGIIQYLAKSACLLSGKRVGWFNHMSVKIEMEKCPNHFRSHPYYKIRFIFSQIPFNFWEFCFFRFNFWESRFTQQCVFNVND